MLRYLLFVLPAMVLMLAPFQAPALGADCGSCAGGGAACADGCSSCATDCGGCQCVQRTVNVPTWVTETRTVQCTEYRPEIREKTVTCYELVRETKDVECEYTVMVPEQRTKVQEYTVCKPVWREEEREYTVMVPQEETRQGTRKVCQVVPVTKTRTICRDEGGWEEQCVTVSRRCCGLCGLWGCCKPSCGSCCGDPCGDSCCQQTCIKKVWVPNIVREEQEYTVNCRQWVDEPCEYTVTVCKPETRTCTVKVCSYEKETKTRECTYTVCVPEKRVKTRQVTTCKRVPVEKVVQCRVMVPVTVEKEVQVRVCKMVPKTVTCRKVSWCGLFFRCNKCCCK